MTSPLKRKPGSQTMGGGGGKTRNHSELTDLNTSGHPSDIITYDNSESGLSASDVQDAIDELAGETPSLLHADLTDLDTSGHNADIIDYDNTASGLSADNVQDALDEIDGDVDTNTSDITTLEGKIHNPNNDLTFLSGRWYDASSVYNGLTDTVASTFNVSTADDEIVVYPFYFPHNTTIDRISCNILTAQAGGTVHVGFYAVNSDGLPSDLLLDSGAISTATTGGKDITVSYTFGKGWYFATLAYTSATNGADIRAHNNSEGCAMFGYTNSTTTNKTNFLYNTFTYSGSLPDPFPLTGVDNFSYNTPRVVVRGA